MTKSNMNIQLGYSRNFTLLAIIFISFSIFRVVQSPPDIIILIGSIIFAYFYTDIISGLLHLILDNENALNISLIKSLAEGFQKHHKDPNHICELSIEKHLYVLHLPLTVIYPLVLLFDTSVNHLMYVIFFFMLHLMQMSHRWSHQAKSVRTDLLCVLQNVHFLLSPSEHGIHHKSPFNTNFCILNGWFNPCLNCVYNSFNISLNIWILLFLFACLLPFLITSIINIYL